METILAREIKLAFIRLFSSDHCLVTEFTSRPYNQHPIVLMVQKIPDCSIRSTQYEASTFRTEPNFTIKNANASNLRLATVLCGLQLFKVKFIKKLLSIYSYVNEVPLIKRLVIKFFIRHDKLGSRETYSAFKDSVVYANSSNLSKIQKAFI
jgi:hypothetical protein